MGNGGKSSGASKGGSRGKGSKARSLGAAAASPKPSGAILDDNDEKLQAKQRFKAWAKGYREQHLKPDMWMKYDKSPNPHMS